MANAKEQLQEKIYDLVKDAGLVRVLEAGCGARGHMDFGERQRISGIDISVRQLERNDYLGEKIVGDIQEYDLTGKGYDFIVCWDVMEHLSRPADALENMWKGLRDGGYLVLAMPNLYSVKGLITKFTPYILHVWFYRYIMGDKRDADEFDQFPTYLRRAMAPGPLCRFAGKLRMEVVHLRLYEGPVQENLRKKSRLLNWGFDWIEMLSKLLTFGRIDMTHSDYIVIFKKVPSRPDSARSGRMQDAMRVP